MNTATKPASPPPAPPPMEAPPLQVPPHGLRERLCLRTPFPATRTPKVREVCGDDPWWLHTRCTWYTRCTWLILVVLVILVVFISLVVLFIHVLGILVVLVLVVCSSYLLYSLYLLYLLYSLYSLQSLYLLYSLCNFQYPRLNCKNSWLDHFETCSNPKTYFYTFIIIFEYNAPIH